MLGAGSSTTVVKEGGGLLIMGWLLEQLQPAPGLSLRFQLQHEHATNLNRKSGPRWNIDIDHYLNRFVPPSPAKRLPAALARFLGYRHEEPKPLGNIIITFWSVIGTVASLSLIHAVNTHIPAFESYRGSLILGSFGAAAVLEFSSIGSPLAQPRNVIIGQVVSSIIGMGMHKGLDSYSSPASQKLQWLAGAASCACAIVFMNLTGTIHPPAGATALLAVIDDNVTQLGWKLVPLVLLSCLLMTVVALLVNNVQRQFPACWWTQGEVGSFWSRGHGDAGDGDVENGKGAANSESDQSASTSGDEGGSPSPTPLVTITRQGILVAPGVHLDPEERLRLEELLHRL